MAVIRWDVLNELHAIRQQLDHVLETLYADRAPICSDYGDDHVLNITETADNIFVTTKVPGMGLHNISAYLDADTLVIKGERKQEKMAFLPFVNRSQPSFELKVPLPARVNAEECIAEYKNGGIEIQLPKKREESPQQISVFSRSRQKQEYDAEIPFFL